MRLEAKRGEQLSRREWAAQHPHQPYVSPEARLIRKWKKEHPGEALPPAVGMGTVNRKDPLIDTPLGVMRKSDYDQVLMEEKVRRTGVAR